MRLRSRQGLGKLLQIKREADAGDSRAKKKVSGRWGGRPLVGMGVMEVHEIRGGVQARPESTGRMPVEVGAVDRTSVHSKWYKRTGGPGVS